MKRIQQRSSPFLSYECYMGTKFSHLNHLSRDDADDGHQAPAIPAGICGPSTEGGRCYPANKVCQQQSERLSFRHTLQHLIWGLGYQKPSILAQPLCSLVNMIQL